MSEYKSRNPVTVTLSHCAQHLCSKSPSDVATICQETHNMLSSYVSYLGYAILASSEVVDDVVAAVRRSEALCCYEDDVHQVTDEEESQG